MTGMAGRVDNHEQFRTTNRVLVIAGAVAVLLIAVVLVVAHVQNQREQAERVDGYYCTLSGVGPFDRAPETGKTCAEILTG